MNDQPSPLDQFEGERRSSSPKRKKIRQKYAPKACVSCRRSKLKCSGENPCQRCIDNGKRCFFSEDQTAAEALQNLSRPLPTIPPPSSANNGNGNGNGNGIPSTHILSQTQPLERRPSDPTTSASSLEARMERIETMMAALMRDRGVAMTPAGLVERENDGSDGMRGVNNVDMPVLDPINPVLMHMSRQSVFSPEPPNWTQASTSAVNPPAHARTQRLIYLGDDKYFPLSFPDTLELERYLTSFFSDVHPRYPCIDEAEFRAQSDSLLSKDNVVDPIDHPLLTLHYIIFACCDVLLEVTPSHSARAPAGLHWCEIAQIIVRQEDLLSGGDSLTLIQLLLYQALFYSFADLPRPAYNCIGLATKRVHKHALHMPSELEPNFDYLRMVIFWTVFMVDRLIALSCGLPYHIPETSIHLEPPMQFFKRVIAPNTVGDCDNRQYFSQYLHYMSLWARFLSDSSVEPTLNEQTRAGIDTEIRAFLEQEAPSLRVPYHHQRTLSTPTCPHKVFLAQIRINLMLKGFRAEILTTQYDNEKAACFLWLALSTIDNMRNFSCEAQSFRHAMVTSLASALLTLCSLLVREALAPGLFSEEQHEKCRQGFRDCVAILLDLNYGLPYARRVWRDFNQIVSVVSAIVNHQTTDPFLLLANVGDLFPYNDLSGTSRQRLSNVFTMDEAATPRASPTSNATSITPGRVALWYC